jgi:hypothetical protein
MSLKATKNAVGLLKTMAESGSIAADVVALAEKELSALKEAAEDLTRLHLSDGVDDVAHREHVIEAMTTPESQWNHPDVVAWSEAAQLLATIAKEAK